jgi:MotA/TolQ/ExbB proton channel family
LRFILANVIAVALVGAAAVQGWIGALLAADEGGLVRAIVAVFLVGLVWSAQRAVQLSRGLNDLERFAKFPGAPAPAYLDAIAARAGESRALLASTLRLKLAARIAPIRHLANSLVLLGLIGTVIGFIIALSGVRPEVASDVAAIGPMVSTLISGMSVALYTTLVGSLLHIWLMVNVRLLEGGTVQLLSATIELGERHVRS